MSKHEHKGSSTIEHSDYNALTRTLSVKFKGGDTIYTYHDVPAHVNAEFVKAKSAGGFHAAKIKGIYKFTKS